MKTTLLRVSTQALPTPKRTSFLDMGSIGVKLEGEQWSGCAKYRLVYSRLMTAIPQGQLDEGTILTEASAGSTGVALAFAGKHLGLPVEIHAYEGASAVKCRTILALGARIVFHARSEPFPGILQEIREKGRKGTHWHLDQMNRPLLLDAYLPLGAEMVSQWNQSHSEAPAVFVCAVGTGGLLQGVGRVLRQSYPRIRIVAVEPMRGSHIDGLRNASEIHMGAADPYLLDFPDERIEVPPPPYLGAVGSTPLGQGATAVWDLVRQRGWDRAFFISPD